MASLEMEFDLGFATLTSSTSTYEHKGDSTSENTGFYAQLNWLALYYYNYPRPMASAVRTYDDDAFVQEIRLVSKGDGNIDWIVGGFYQDLDQVATQTSYLRGWANYFDAAWGDCFCVDDTDFRYNRDENFTESALFGELTYHVSDQFRITGGFRYFDNDYENQTFIGVGIWTEDIFRTSDNEFFSGSESDTLFKFNLAYDVNEDAMLYGTISEGFRRGGTNAVPLSGTFAEDPAWLRYEPDTTTNYEVGIKGNWNNSFYNVSLFYVDWDKIQLNTATTNWAFYAAQNGSSATTKGVEAEYSVSFGEGWLLNLGYAYTDGELDSDMISADDVYVVAPAGSRLPGLAEHTVNMTLEYAFELRDGIEWVNRVNGYYQSETKNHINDNSFFFGRTMGSFSLWNFNSNLIFGNWSAGLFVKNLFNEAGVVGIFTEEYMGTSPDQNYYGNGAKNIVARPRTVGVSASWNF